ncbi:hypothetical protein [Sagittula sp. S175]|uniref:hypothetical protein n=1 Tax=Sagittula sp. S175 TaxID=3415129 RepID=UPI003C7EA4CC
MSDDGKFDQAFAGARLREIGKILGSKSMPDRLGVSRSTYYNYCERLTAEKARIAAFRLQVPIEAFYDSEFDLSIRNVTRVQSNYTSDAAGRRVAIFDGSNTGLLTDFLVSNADFISSFCKVFIVSQDESVFLPNSVSAELDGYRRTVVVDAKTEIGGENAILESVKLKEIRFELIEENDRVLRYLKFPFLFGPNRLLGVQDALSMRACHRPEEAIACCSIMPNSSTFGLMREIAKEYFDDFEIMSVFFDNLKRFKAHLRLHNFDGQGSHTRISFEMCQSFVKTWLGEEDAGTAVSYALEAIPFCVCSNPRLTIQALKFIDDIEAASGAYKHAADVALAAIAARKYLAVLSNAN